MNIGSVIDLEISESGFAPRSARDRKIYDGSEFDKYFTEPNQSKDCKKRDGSVEDTVAEMKVIIKTKSNQVRALSKEVLAITNADGTLNIRSTVQNIFNFIFKYIKYNLEKGEQLQSPRHLWWRGQKLARVKEKPTNSGDCDCMAIFAGSCMYQLGIPFALRIAGYTSDNYQHVYCIAYDGGIPIICDPVTDTFDYEKPPVIQKTYPMSSNMLSGIDIYVLDGIEDLPVKGVYREQPDGGLVQISGVGTLGKSKKKAEKKAAKKQAKAEKKAAKKQAKVEKKAAKLEKKAEKKAEKKIQKAEKKAAKLEKKAEKKGGKKAEKLLKKAQTVRENAEMKAEAIKEKAHEKAENKQKKIQEKLEKKTAKIEVKRLKQSGASKEEIKAAKQHLKDVKKEIKKAKKEDGRGFFRKMGKGIKSATMLPVRAAFLMLMNINFRGLSSRLYNNPQAYDKFVKTWKNVFGGKEVKLKIAINKGKNHKPLFGSKKTNSQIPQETTEEVSGFLQGYYLGALGVEPATATTAACITAASSALAALTKILKDMGVNVPESLEDAIAAGEDVAEMFPDEEISEDSENWENPDEYEDEEYNADTDGDGVISKKEAKKAKKAAKKAEKAKKKAAKKAEKAEKKAAKKAARNSDDDDNDDESNSDKMAKGNFFKKVGEGFKKAVNVVTDITNATKEVEPPQVVDDEEMVVPESTTSKGKTVKSESTTKEKDEDTNWFKENPILATGLGIAGVTGIVLLIYSLTSNSSAPQSATPTATNTVPIQGIDLL